MSRSNRFDGRARPLDMPLQHGAADIMLSVKASEDMLWDSFGADAKQLASTLADEVMRYERERRLEYYPALSEILTDLNSEAGAVMQRGASALAAKVSAEIKARLTSVFSMVRVVSLRNLMYNLPPVSVGQSDARAALSAHYEPSRLRVGARVSQIRYRAVANAEKHESYVVNMCHLWLRDSGIGLETVVVSSHE